LPETAAGSHSEFDATPQAEPDAELDEDAVRQWLVDYLVDTIGIAPEDIDCDAPLSDLAVGSADAVVLAGELSELVGRMVSPLEFWQYPTVNLMARFVTGGEVEPVFDASAVAAPAGGAAPVENDPIAVIGLGCRLPGGVHGPDEFWDFLAEGRSGVREVPAERWEWCEGGSPESAAALAATTRWGGFLDDLAEFDAEFFEVPPREADKMDPQQRLLLEVTHEALEHAGITPQSLRHTQTGVFAGACLGEYGSLLAADLAGVDAWSGTGGALSIIANRVSYFFDFRGPSVTVDTACSSSLVAAHLACQSLRSGDSDVALAAGVNVLLSPAPTRSFDSAEVMSASGRCHAFDGRADGFVRSEGAGVVVLKRLSDAVRDGDRVLAVIRGSAVNQDGRSNGLMAPNPAAQMAVLRAAYANAGIDGREVDYVEAHGTGTLLGDPIEARGLGTVLGRGRPAEAPLLIGSVKSNLGHLESAAGVTGLIKAVLAVHRGEIPANLGYEVPNPHIPFDSLRLKVVAEPTPWAATGRPRRAGVSSFGFGGTNAHVVIEQAPAQAPAQPPTPADSPVVTTLVVSGKTPARIAALAGMLADWMDGAGSEVPLSEVAHTVNHHRARYGQFATVCGRDRDQVVNGLRALAEGRTAPGVAGAHRGQCRQGTVFVFSGQGSQWPGMARQLLVDEPAFAGAIDDIDPVFVEQVGFSLRQVLVEGETVTGDARVQPVLMGLQLALTALWRSYGVVPDAVIGHSMGEVTAAVVAGALSTAEGLRVIATRSRLMAKLGGQGAVGLVELDGEATAEAVTGYPGVEVAGYLSPRQSVVAGPVEQVEDFLADQTAQDRFARRVNMELASHTALMDPVLGELRQELADLTPRTPVIPFISTVNDPADVSVVDADYWADNVRRPVNFERAITAAADYGTFIEVSPNPILTYAIDDTLTSTHHHAVATLSRDADDTIAFHTHLNATHTVHPPTTPHLPEPHIALPTTPWHPTHHWAIKKLNTSSEGTVARPGTLLGGHIPVGGAVPAHLWQARLVATAKPYKGFRRIDGVEVVPTSVLLQTLAVAAAECGASAVEDVRLESPVVFDRPRVVQVFSDGQTVTISSAVAAEETGADPDAEPQWVRHASARLSHRLPESVPGSDYDPAGAALENTGHDPAALVEIYRDWGVEGQAFEWSLDSHESTAGRLRADVRVPDLGLPALLDAALDMARLVDGSNSGPMLPTALEGFSVAATAPAMDLPEGLGVIEIRQRPGDDLTVDVELRATDGQVLADLRGLEYSTVAPGTGLTFADPRTIAHQIDWQPRILDTDGEATVAAPAPLAVVGASQAAQALRDRFAVLGYPEADIAHARYVVYVAGPGETGNPETDVDTAVRLTAEVGALVAKLAEREYRHPATLWILTHGVYDAGTDEALRQSSLWGLSGVIGAEQPQLWGGLVDIPAGDDPADCALALSEVLHHPAKATLLLRNGEFLAAALAPLSGESTREPLRCRPEGAYLITGGLGELGLLMADWLVDRGARRLVLAGRTALPPRRGWDDTTLPADTRRRIAAVRGLEMRGVSVDVVSLDTGSPDAVRALVDKRTDDGHPPILGVIHAAGLTEGQLVTELDTSRVERTVWPKIAGAQALNQVFPPGSVDFLFLIASAGAVFGVPGQAAYAAGNAYLDCLARARHRLGCNTVSLDWVAWQGLGFAKEAHVVVQELERMGSRPVNPAEAFAAWEYVTRYDLAQVVMAPMQSAEAALSAANVISRPARDWSLTSPEDLRTELQAGMRAILAGELHLPEDEVELDRPFAEMGLNSVMAMSIRRQAEELVGMELSATMLWNHPTIATFSNYLAKQLQPDAYPDDEDDDASADATASVLDSLFDSIESTPLL
jgi:phthiocerol/phenolphthiocerol synthesis type-I polyketide synthase A